MHGRLIALMAWMTVALVMTACAPLATWPPTEGSQVLVPWATPCPQCMATAVTFTRQRTTPTAPLVFNLPPNTEAKVWEQVQKRLGDDARPMDSTDAVVFSVQQLRLDGGRAEVDVVYRTPEGIWQLATVHLTGSFGGAFRPTYFQHWRIPVDAPVANAPAAPVTENASVPEEHAPAAPAPAGGEPAV